MNEHDKFVAALDHHKIDSEFLDHAQIAYLMVSGHRILGHRPLPGLDITATELADGIVARLHLSSNVKLVHPVHLCFGALAESERQRIQLQVTLEDGATADIVAHGLFPNARQVEHAMNGEFNIGEGARLHYRESGHHGVSGGVVVTRKLKTLVARQGLFRADFSVLDGRIGQLDIDHEAMAEDEASAELVNRLFARGVDAIRLRERVVLAGRSARCRIKTRIAAEDKAAAEIIGIIDADAENARGHIDCLGIVKDKAVVSARPQVKVSHPSARVTHEAAIGSLDAEELNSLLARGLSPEQAMDLIVGGLLGEQEANRGIRFQPR